MPPISNSDFLAYAYGLAEGEYGWTASFRNDPGAAPAEVWQGQPWTGSEAQAALIDQRPEDNNFFCVAVLSGDPAKRHKAQFKRHAVLLADDIDPAHLMSSAPYILETSPGRYQAGVVLDPADPDVRDPDLVETVIREMVGRGLIGADRSGNSMVRYGRLPVGSNTKARNGEPFSTRLISQPDGAFYSLADAAAAFGVDLDALRAAAPQARQERLESRQRPVEHYRALLNPDPMARAYHDPLLKISAQWVSSGMSEAVAIEHLRALGEVIRPANDNAEELARHAARFGPELERMVQGASDKFTREEMPKPVGKEKLIRTLDEVGEAFEDIDWLVDDLIPEQSVGMIFGASGSYKSFIAISLACCMANGLDFVDRETRKAPVLYIASEGGGGIYRRFQAWHSHHGLPISNDVLLVTTPIILTDKEQLETLVTAIQAMKAKPALVVIDTLSQTFSGEENSSKDIAAYLRTINTEIRTRFGCSVIIIHHTGHNAAERPRGSSAMIANLDFLLGVFKPDPESQTARMTVVKQKDGDRLPDVYFTMDRTDLGANKKGKPVGSLAARYVTKGAASTATPLTLADWRKVQNVIAEGEWRQDHQTGDAWAGLAIAEALGIDPRAKGRLQELLSMGLRDGHLAIDRRPARKNGRPCPFVVVEDA